MEQPTAAAKGEEEAADITILVVDDHPIVRHGLVEVLSNPAGLRVVGAAATVDEALQAARTLLPRVVVVDMRLDGEDGLELAMDLRWDHPEIAVVAYTSYANERLVRRCHREGVTGFVVKGSPLETLVEAVRTVARGGSYLDPRFPDGMRGRGHDDDVLDLDAGAGLAAAGTPPPPPAASAIGDGEGGHAAPWGPSWMTRHAGNGAGTGNGTGNGTGYGAGPGGTAPAIAPAAWARTRGRGCSPGRPYGLTPRELDVLMLVRWGHSNAEIAEELGVALATVKTHIQHILQKMGANDRRHAVRIAVREQLA